MNKQEKCIYCNNKGYINNHIGSVKIDCLHCNTGEKPKQESLTYTESAKKEERIFNSSMMKQEIPEEASERIYDDNLFDYEKYRDGFMVGTKWQAERSYSEEEVMNIIDSFIDNLQDYTPTFNSRREWFKQFKKK
jgi:hypothetical protein